MLPLGYNQLGNIKHKEVHPNCSSPQNSDGKRVERLEQYLGGAAIASNCILLIHV
jgi:hypothetical protein